MAWWKFPDEWNPINWILIIIFLAGFGLGLFCAYIAVGITTNLFCDTALEILNPIACEVQKR